MFENIKYYIMNIALFCLKVEKGETGIIDGLLVR